MPNPVSLDTLRLGVVVEYVPYEDETESGYFVVGGDNEVQIGLSDPEDGDDEPTIFVADGDDDPGVALTFAQARAAALILLAITETKH